MYIRKQKGKLLQLAIEQLTYPPKTMVNVFFHGFVTFLPETNECTRTISCSPSPSVQPNLHDTRTLDPASVLPALDTSE